MTETVSTLPHLAELVIADNHGREKRFFKGDEMVLRLPPVAVQPPLLVSRPGGLANGFTK